MTYPGTQRRAQTALESSLIAQVLELERERDELVEALKNARWYAEGYQPITDSGIAAHRRNLELIDATLARYPK